MEICDIEKMPRAVI
uniref:Uncharacterized protein n=1 Tax=Arundo donax TaxID=35708 RepID=A0A0A8YZP1_ARUDO